MPKILIVDDEAYVCTQLEERLISMGYDVVGRASSGKASVEMAKSLDPDVVLMDIVMPGKLDGIGAAEIIKEEQDIPVIFLTAYTEDDLIQKAKHVEPYGYIVKPFQESEVKATIEVALYKKEMEKRNGLRKLMRETKAKKLLEERVEKLELELESDVTHQAVKRRFAPKKQVNQYHSVEFSISGCAFTYQFKIWDIPLKGISILVKEDSDLLNHLKVHDTLNLKYYTTDLSSSVKYLKTEIRHINKDDTGRFKGLYLVGLSILEDQSEGNCEDVVHH